MLGKFSQWKVFLAGKSTSSYPITVIKNLTQYVLFIIFENVPVKPLGKRRTIIVSLTSDLVIPVC